LPDPFKPKTPIFAPGKKDKEIPFSIVLLGGTIFPTCDMENTYCDIPTIILRKTLF
jgi:hypothetical protein